LRYINYLNDEGSIETLKSFRDVRKYLTPKIRNGTLEKPAKMKVEEYLEIGQYCRGLLSILCLQLSEFSHHPHASPWNYDFRVAWFFIFVSTWTHAPPHIAIIITFFFLILTCISRLQGVLLLLLSRFESWKLISKRILLNLFE